jgi:GTP-binding protein LepA
MIIDSWFDAYVGVVMLVRVVDGRLAKGDRIKMMATDRCTTPTSSGSSPHPMSRVSLEAGEVGYVIAGIKELQGGQGG